MKPGDLLACVQAAGVLCLMDIAAGMEHLHSLGVLHVGASHSQPARPHNIFRASPS